MEANQKGFTLIELLAVIVILAIIALIATPIVLNIIEKAREGAIESSAYGVVDAARLAYTESLMEPGSAQTSGNVVDLKLSGDSAIAGTWSLDTSSGNIYITGVKFNSNDAYTCTNTSGSMECTK